MLLLMTNDFKNQFRLLGIELITSSLSYYISN